jgi:hypothetical protein
MKYVNQFMQFLSICEGACDTWHFWQEYKRVITTSNDLRPITMFKVCVSIIIFLLIISDWLPIYNNRKMEIIKFLFISNWSPLNTCPCKIKAGTKSIHWFDYWCAGIFNSIFSNISAISWRCTRYKTTLNIMFYFFQSEQMLWQKFYIITK